MENKLKTVSFGELLDEHLGKPGTKRRDDFENDVRADTLGLEIRQVRLRLGLTQSQLGELVGVQKAQISKIENSAKDVRIGTLLRVFKALGVNLHFSIEMDAETKKKSSKKRAEVAP